MQEYQVTSPVQCGRRRYEPGETIDLDSADAQPLIAAGALAAPDAPDTDTDTDAGIDTDIDAGRPGGGEDDREAALLAAIAGLEAGNPDHWTKSGKPEVRALEAAAGLKDVSAAERDVVWDAYRATRA